MSARYSKKHIRRQKDDAHAKWVSVDVSGLVVTVSPPSWPTPRDFDFAFLTPFASTELAQAIALAFGQYAPRFARRTSLDRYQQFRRLWTVVAAQMAAPPNTSNLRAGDLAEWWRAAAHKYALNEYQRAGKPTSAKVRTQSLFAVLDEFASCGLLVDVPATKSPKNVHLQKVPRPSLVEQTRSAREPAAEEKSALIQHFRSIGIPVENTEAEQSIAHLLGLLTPEERKDPKKASQAYFVRTNEFLLALTTAAETEFIKWQRHFEDGRALLPFGDPAVLVAYDAGEFFAPSNAIFRQYFPKNDTRTATANFLLLARERFQGCSPSENALELPFRSRLQKLVSDLGGKHHLDSMLTLHRNGVAAAAFLYIRDTGANLSTCLSLSSDFERPTSEPGVVEFFAVKARANYKAIYDCLSVNDPGRRISTVKTLRAVKDMTSTLRSNFSQLNDSLFVFRFFSEPSVANSAFLGNQFQYLLASANLPVDWTLSGIRAAVGITHVLDGTGTLNGVARKLHQGKKSAATTAGYALRWPVRTSLELQMAKYQDLFQAGIASNLEAALAWLGKSADEAEEVLREARRTGLGFLCIAPDAGARPGTKAGSPCGKTGECPQCPVHVFLADEESLAEVVATNLSLQTNESRLRLESAERFENFWAELLAFTTVAISSAKRGPHAYLMPRAERKAEQWIASGFDITDLRP